MALLLLDRDGVINENLPQSVWRVEDFSFIPGSLDALKLLHQAGIKVAVCTNQSCVGQGYITQSRLDEIHAYMCDRVRAHGGMIHQIYAATDHPDNPTENRKPGAGMLLRALQDFGATPAQTPFIGDNITDMMAAQKAGCPAILLRTGHGAEMEARVREQGLPVQAVHHHLLDAVLAYLSG